MILICLQCAGSCEEGWQRRQVECKTHDGELSEQCDVNSRPIDGRRCDMSCEEELATQDGMLSFPVKPSGCQSVHGVMLTLAVISPSDFFKSSDNKQCLQGVQFD